MVTKAPLFPCPACTRHVRVSEAVCPFCQVSLSDEFRAQSAPRPPTGRLGRAALSALGAGTIVLASSCSSQALYGAPPVDASTEVSPIADAAYGGPPTDSNIRPLYGAPPQDPTTADAAKGGTPTDGAGD